MHAPALSLPHSNPAFATRIERWSSEKPLFVLVLLAAVAIWLLLALSIIGVLYAGLIAAFLFFSHVVFIAHIRGSGVRLGPEQFPELWERVTTLSRQSGMAGFALWMATLQSLTDVASATTSTDTHEEQAATPQRPVEELETQARADLATIAGVVRAHHDATDEKLADSGQLDAVWSKYRDDVESPVDPFDGYGYGFRTTDGGVSVFSSGPDAEAETEDDIVVDIAL